MTHAVEQLGNLVEDQGSRRGAKGPAEKLIRVNTTAGSFIGISIRPSGDVGVSISAVITSLDGTPLDPEHHRSAEVADRFPLEVVAAIEGLIRSVQEDAHDAGPVLAVGIELGGVILHGRVEHSPNLGWRRVELAEDVRRRLGIPTFVENDANAIALYSAWSAPGHRGSSLTAVILDDGIGAGLVIDQSVHHGWSGMAGEIGHMTVAPDLFIQRPRPLKQPSVSELQRWRNDHPCTCNRVTGCVETFASRPAIVQYHQEISLEARKGGVARRGSDSWDLREIVGAAEAGDDLAEYVLKRAAWAFGLALVSMIDVVDIQSIVIHSRELHDSEVFRREVSEALRTAVFPTDEAVERRLRYESLDPALGANGAAVTALLHWATQDAVAALVDSLDD